MTAMVLRDALLLLSHSTATMLVLVSRKRFPARNLSLDTIFLAVTHP